MVGPLLWGFASFCGVLRGRELGFGYPLYIDDVVVLLPALWPAFSLFSFPAWLLPSF